MKNIYFLVAQMKRGAVRWCRSGRRRGSIGRSPGGGRRRGPSYPKGIMFAETKKTAGCPHQNHGDRGGSLGDKKTPPEGCSRRQVDCTLLVRGGIFSVERGPVGRPQWRCCRGPRGTCPATPGWGRRSLQVGGLVRRTEFDS